MAQMVKNLPAMQETWFRSQGWEEPLEKGMGYRGSAISEHISWVLKLKEGGTYKE